MLDAIYAYAGMLLPLLGLPVYAAETTRTAIQYQKRAADGKILSRTDLLLCW